MSAASSIAIAAGSLIVPALSRATPLALAGLGGIFSERGGIVNIALEGIMLTGAFVGVVAGQKYGPNIGLACAIAAGILVGILHYIFTQRFRMDHVISGVAINILALQGTTFLGRKLYPTSDLAPTLQSGFSANNFIIMTILLVVVSQVVLFHTRFGLHLRSVGESPLSARMSGLNPLRLRLLGIFISGSLAGLAGAYLSMSQTTRFTDNMVSGRGFIALAAVICGKWNPIGMAIAALVFGLLDALQNQLQGTVSVPGELLRSMPYIITIFAALLLRPKAPLALGSTDDGQ